ncbi:deoxyribodipyrimidine photolyase [Litoribacter alkaliphilus]|uniref:Deoxyribodipyrimidine photolyase n=1 Tax=Litoribacter ruber TaxID=702568 RepID=A0AAP2CMI1_9BACT|nr:FAD-binding domain-containing protein [Litoribacter alkaliphilus]MBS9525285.1 deoxyribodipyrimidine photolyase [Litoribacter alkaliphilus]
MNFPTDYQSILKRIDDVDPVAYAKTRNFVDGNVTYLSPYISRGVISTKLVFERIMAKGYEWKDVVRLAQELAWREYFQRVWQNKGHEIDYDLKSTQEDVSNHAIPKNMLNHSIGIEALDQVIKSLYQTGYMHNHCRMYTASLASNMGKSHWKLPAQWLYYHLLDGDWASNALSWQWVAGSFSSKKYIFNQENLNKYTRSSQSGTFLDKEYEEIREMEIPDELQEITDWKYDLPSVPDQELKLDSNLPTVLYTSYNLDPQWRKDEALNRVFLIEPSILKKYPVSQKCLDFALGLSKNITGIQLAYVDFITLEEQNPQMEFVYKEHPLNGHFEGTEDQRDWLAPEITGYFPSFFKFWKQAEKEIKRCYGV